MVVIAVFEIEELMVVETESELVVGRITPWFETEIISPEEIFFLNHRHEIKFRGKIISISSLRNPLVYDYRTYILI